MTLTAEQLAIVKACSSTEELIAKAAEAGIELSQDFAQQLLDGNEFTEVEPEDVTAAGGACNDTYKCFFCEKEKKKSDGVYYYRENRPSFTGAFDGFVFEMPACPACRQENREKPGWVDNDRAHRVG